ncbi:hypothetical protein [Paraburkholderia unamae]|uniref:Uncharacterized protein n=1 Tax=Paraburkholderia unamae TaxID=219649 RepID=A0ABX5KW42_9BURK|nr:hypothetical protein [Paraburkholderia unamae]PVX86428.1 hypothetical protein C7402_102264 [Paraburkholderia unamae]
MSLTSEQRKAIMPTAAEVIELFDRAVNELPASLATEVWQLTPLQAAWVVGMLLQKHADAAAAPAAAAPELVVSAGDLDFTPDEQHSICDMANIGKALLERISSMYPDYVWNESPTEIVSDLINERDDERANYDRIRHGLARWAAQRWSDEVRNRPLINVHRRALDDTWRQVIRYCGADDVAMLGPTHGDLVAVASTPIVAPAAAQERPDSMPPFSEVVEHAQDDARPPALGAAAVERLQSTPLANVARAASTPSNTGELIRQINGGGAEPIASPLWAAYDALRAIIHALDAGQDAALILDENSPLVDAARSALAARAAAASPLHFELRFPATLRKMWSGREVQSWLDELPPLYEVPTHAQDGNNGNTSPIEGAAPAELLQSTPTAAQPDECADQVRLDSLPHFSEATVQTTDDAIPSADAAATVERLQSTPLTAQLDERTAIPVEVIEALSHAVGAWRGAACGTRDDEEGEGRSVDYCRRAKVIEDWLYARASASQASIAQLSTQTVDKPMQSDAERDVLAERARQVSEEGWTPTHDDQNDLGQLASAAACYALTHRWTRIDAPPPHWPGDWARAWWKPTTARRDLVKAGALIIAEVERIDRAETDESRATVQDGPR